jgi:hypothetical protein
MNIHIFKTNISNTTAVSNVGKVFSNITGVEEWSVDLEDVDKVLRVVTSTLSTKEITDLINGAGYSCQELD